MTRSNVLSDVAVKTAYVSLAATAFIFISLLLIGLHP
jgi:hypothetical protein